MFFITQLLKFDTNRRFINRSTPIRLSSRNIKYTRINMYLIKSMFFIICFLINKITIWIFTSIGGQKVSSILLNNEE